MTWLRGASCRSFQSDVVRKLGLARRLDFGGTTQSRRLLRALATGSTHSRPQTLRGTGELNHSRGDRRPRGLPGQAQLLVHIRQVSLDRTSAEVEAARNLLVAQSIRNELEDLKLSSTQRSGLAGRPPRRDPKKAAKLSEERLPGGLFGEEDMIASVKGDEASVRHGGGETPAVRERDHLVVARVEDDRRRPQARGELSDVDAVERFAEAES